VFGLIYSVLLSAAMLSSVLLYTANHLLEAIFAFGLAGIFSIALARVLRRLMRPDAELG
jgi:branched-subunit amino acid transport protein